MPAGTKDFFSEDVAVSLTFDDSTKETLKGLETIVKDLADVVKVLVASYADSDRSGQVGGGPSPTQTKKQESSSRIPQSSGSGWDESNVSAAAQKWGLGEFSQTGKLSGIDWKQLGSQVVGSAEGAGVLSSGSAATLTSAIGATAGAIAVVEVMRRVTDAAIAQYTGFRNQGLETGETGANAAAAGVGMDVSARAMAISPFINVEQAKSIVNAVYQKGYNGKEAETVLDFAAQNFEKFNTDVADSLVMYELAVKQGTMSVDELTASLEAMRMTARETGVSVSFLSSSMTEMMQTYAAGTGAPAEALTNMPAVAGVLSTAGVSEAGTKQMMLAAADPMSAIWMQPEFQALSQQEQLAAMQNPEQWIQGGQEMVLELIFPGITQMAAQYSDPDEFATAAKLRYNPQTFDIAPNEYKQVIGNSYNDAIRTAFAVSRGYGQAIAELEGERTKKRGMSKSERALRGNLVTGTAMQGMPLATGMGIGALQRFFKGTEGTVKYLTGDETGAHEMYEQMRGGEFADTKAFGRFQLNRAMQQGQTFTWEEQEAYKRQASQFGAGGIPTQEVVVTFKGSADKLLMGIVKKASNAFNVGKGIGTTNEE